MFDRQMLAISKPVVDAVALDAPVLRLARIGDGKYDIDDIVARFAKPSPDKSSDPLHFALFNLVLKDGALEFDDRPVGKKHSITGVAIGVPFLSNLPGRYQIKVEPRLAFNLNGSSFDSQAQTTPFAETATMHKCNHHICMPTPIH